MQRLLYLGKHGLIFVLAKSAVLIAPLLAAGLLGKALYGTVEWWLALSLAFGPLMAMGAPGLLAYGTLGDKFRRHVRTATVFVLIATAALLLLSLIAPLLGLDWNASLLGPVALQCAVVILQMTLSARLKGLGKGAWASLVESTLYLSLLFALLLFWQGFNFINSFMGMMLFSCSLLISALIHFVPVPSFYRWPKRNYKAFLRVGLHFMAGSSLMGIFMALPRVSLGVFAKPEEVANFALTFRWLSIAIIAHQFINTIFFRKIFADADGGRRDRMLASTVLLVGFGTVGILLALYIAQELDVPIPNVSSMDLAWLMSIAIIMWSTTACLEGSLYREGYSLRQMGAIVAGLLVQTVMLAFLVLFFNGDELVFRVIYAWVIGLSVIIGMQLFSLRIIGHPMPLLFCSLCFCVSWFMIPIVLDFLDLCIWNFENVSGKSAL